MSLSHIKTSLNISGIWAGSAVSIFLQGTLRRFKYFKLSFASLAPSSIFFQSLSKPYKYPESACLSTSKILFNSGFSNCLSLSTLRFAHLQFQCLISSSGELFSLLCWDSWFWTTSLICLYQQITVPSSRQSKSLSFAACSGSDRSSFGIYKVVHPLL